MSQDSKFIPFYSEVHPDIQEELKFRAQCSIENNRTPEQIEWLNSRSSWGSVTLLESDKETVRAAINNPGLSTDRTPSESDIFYKGAKSTENNKKKSADVAKGFTQNSANNTPVSLNPLSREYLASNYINTRSGRTPPALQSITFSLADTSAGAQGLLNDAQVTILVPDIEYFINVFERKWLRLGYKAIIEIGHSVRIDRRGNYGRFEGHLVNFNFEYQTNASVLVVLYFKSSTDLATVIPSVNKNNDSDEKKEPTSGEQENTNTQSKRLISSKLLSIAEEVFPADEQLIGNRAHIFDVNYIEDRVLNDTSDTLVDAEFKFRSLIQNENKQQRTKATKTALIESSSLSPGDKTTYDIFMAQINSAPNNDENNEVDDSKTEGTETGTYLYVSLGMIIKMLNSIIRSAIDVSEIKSKSPLDTVYISVAPEFSTSLYFEELISNDHEKVILPSSKNFNSDVYVNINPQLPAAANVTNVVPQSDVPLRLGHITSIMLPDGTETQDLDRISFYRKSTEFDTNVGVPANILIRIDQIRLIELKLQDNETPDKPFNIDLFINEISKLINKHTSGAINLKLTALPTTDIPGLTTEFKNKNMLILKDTVASVPESAGYSTKPTKIPMFVNSMNQMDASISSQTENISNSVGYTRTGTVVRNFKIVGKIPNSLKTINLVLSQTSGIPKDMLAHYLTYIEAETNDEQDRVETEYKEAYDRIFENLIQAKLEYYNKPFNDDIKIDLQEALKAYVSVPKKSLSNLFSFTSPPYPLNVEIELDGCYGFRFGDILSVEGLPAQYNKFVFSIIKIDHSLLSNDWSTKLTCLMRPNLSPRSNDDSTSNLSQTVTKKRSE